MANGAAAPLQQAAADREARIVEIGEGDELAHALTVEQFRIDAGKPHGVAAPHIGVPLRVGVIDIEHAALADHAVVVQLLAQPFPLLQRMLVEERVRRQHIVGADDGGVAADIAGAEIALVDHGDIGDAVLAAR